MFHKECPTETKDAHGYELGKEWLTRKIFSSQPKKKSTNKNWDIQDRQRQDC